MKQTIPIDDRGLTLGVGLFETILAVGGRLALWDAHLDRLERGCAKLSLPPPDRAECLRAAHEALAGAKLLEGRAAVRLTWTGGGGARGLAMPAAVRPRLFVTASPAPSPPASLTLHTATIRRNGSSPTSRLKTLSYIDNVEARAQAIRAGADEALMLDQDGSVACAAAANIFWLERDGLRTPALECGVLDGVVRAEILRLAPDHGLRLQEVHADRRRLMACKAAFTTNSLQGAVPVRRIDDIALPLPGGALAGLLTDLRRAMEGRE